MNSTPTREVLQQASAAFVDAAICFDEILRSAQAGMTSDVERDAAHYAKSMRDEAARLDAHLSEPRIPCPACGSFELKCLRCDGSTLSEPDALQPVTVWSPHPRESIRTCIDNSLKRAAELLRSTEHEGDAVDASRLEWIRQQQPDALQAAAQPVAWCHRCGEGVVPGMPCRSRPVDASCPRATPPAGERSPSTEQDDTPWTPAQLDGIADAVRDHCGPATAKRVRAILASAGERSPDDWTAQRIEDAREAGFQGAVQGVQLMCAGFDDLPFEGCPEEWCEKPFARIAYFYDRGDPTVGEPARSGWTLAEDQSGTVVSDLAASATQGATGGGL